MPTTLLTPRKVARYGWRPDLPDPRDLVWDPRRLVSKLPTAVDLRATGDLDEPYDQLQLGACTGNAIAAAVDFANHAQTGSFARPSRLFIYWGERFLEGTVGSDSGAQIRDGIKVVHKQGVPAETLWPYDVSRFKAKPSAAAFKAATADEALVYRRVPRASIRNALASGYPVVIGFTVFDEFEGDDVASTGLVPMPAKGAAPIGGHAVLLVGYVTKDGVDYYIARNSWGKKWGDGGYFYLPRAYVADTSLASDFWTITKTGAAA